MQVQDWLGNVDIITLKQRVYEKNMNSRMSGEHNEEQNRASDKDDGESDGTDAVEYSSCQHPVVIHLILLVIFTTLFFSFVNLGLQKITESLQQPVRRLVLQRWRITTIPVAVSDVKARTFCTPKFHWCGGRSVHAQTCCEFLAE